MKTLKVLIADDHSIVCECLKISLELEGAVRVAGVASRGEDVYKMAGEIKPDVVIMDVSMPGLGGAAATKRIKEVYPQISVLAFSAHEDDAYVRQLISAGASGYILKATSVQTLTHALRIIADGGTYIDPLVARNLLKASTGLRIGSSDSLAEPALSNREATVLRLSARGLTNKEIASIIGVGVKSIETYKTRIYKKLNLESRSDLVRYALTQG